MSAPSDRPTVILRPVDGYEQVLLGQRLDEYGAAANRIPGPSAAGYRETLLAAVLRHGGIRVSQAPVLINDRYPGPLNREEVSRSIEAVVDDIGRVRGAQQPRLLHPDDPDLPAGVIAVPGDPSNPAIRQEHLTFLREKRADYERRATNAGTHEYHSDNAFRIALIDTLLERGVVDPIGARQAFDRSQVRPISDAAAQRATQTVMQHTLYGDVQKKIQKDRSL